MPSLLSSFRPRSSHGRKSSSASSNKPPPSRRQSKPDPPLPDPVARAPASLAPPTPPLPPPGDMSSSTVTTHAKPHDPYSPAATTTLHGHSVHSTSVANTIRTVPSFEAPSLSSSTTDSPSARNSGFSSSIASNVSANSYVSQPPHLHAASSVRLKQHPDSPNPNLPASPMSLNDATLRVQDPVSLQVPDASPADDPGRASRESSPQWDGTVGKAGLGKTGRVINKLVSDNEALKRDLQIERLRADESKQSAKLVEDKMDRMVQDYESRLLEANVTKTLLSRKERQVESLQAAVELEKKRTADAQERERVWKDEMEKSQRESKIQVEEATAHAGLMEGRYNAISSHWKDQGQEVKRSVAEWNTKIEALNEERRKDDDKINVLRDLCDQQDGNIRDLRRQKDEIAQQFEAYKQHQDDMLKRIKESATQREAEQLRTIEETKNVLGQLRWALKVKENVKGAQ